MISIKEIRGFSLNYGKHSGCINILLDYHFGHYNYFIGLDENSGDCEGFLRDCPEFISDWIEPKYNKFMKYFRKSANLKYLVKNTGFPKIVVMDLLKYKKNLSTKIHRNLPDNLYPMKIVMYKPKWVSIEDL